MNERRLHVVGETKVDAAHRACWDLLPWFVNGTLSAAQIEPLEAHLRECVACTEELSQQRELRDRLREQARIGDAVLLAPQAGWQKMADRLDVEMGETGGAQRRMQARRRVLAGRLAASLAIVSIVGLSAALVWQGRENAQRAEPRYQTLTTEVPSAGSGGQLRIVFAREVAVNDAAALLHAIPAQIIGGPSEAGVYTVALQNEATPVSELLARLRADARIVFVEPVVHIQRAQ